MKRPPCKRYPIYGGSGSSGSYSDHQAGKQSNTKQTENKIEKYEEEINFRLSGHYLLLLVLIPPVLTRAEKHSLITWEKKSKNVVSMYLELQEKEAFEEIKAFSLTLNFDSKEDLSEEPVFKFGSDFKGEKVSVHEERYNEEDQTMKLYVRRKGYRP
mgnify:CR=1 FL=1